MESVSSVGWQGIGLITSLPTPATIFYNPNCSAITPSVDGGAEPPKPYIRGQVREDLVCMSRLHIRCPMYVCTCVNASYDDILYLCCTPRLYCNRRMYESPLELRDSGSGFVTSVVACGHVNLTQPDKCELDCCHCQLFSYTFKCEHTFIRRCF